MVSRCSCSRSILLVTLGAVVTLGCLTGRPDDRLLRRHVQQQQRLRRLVHLQPVDPASHRRGLRVALDAGIVFGVLVVAAGLLALV